MISKICNYGGGDCCLPLGYGNGVCDDLFNNNRMCKYDKGDCCTGNLNTIGDGLCQDKNNNGQCGFDGGDCCLSNVVTSFCTICECIENEVIQSFDPCPNHHKMGNGICDEENNNKLCLFDGRDCLPSYIFDGQCPKFSQIGDGTCQEENNIEICLFDGGDCCLGGENTTQYKCNTTEDEYDPCPEGDKIGDGTCNLSNNNTICSFDGGDCSRQSFLYFFTFWMIF